nr:hypothetical protein [Candidatus Freyarchaeota archaeon]
MTKIDPLYNTLAFGAILVALDKLGVNPMLTARYTSRVLGSMLIELVRQAKSTSLANNLEEFVQNWAGTVRTFRFLDPEKSEISLSGKTIFMKIVDCMYKGLADFGRSQGYPACPLCPINLIMAGYLKARGIGEVLDIKVENSENVCKVKMVVD